MIKTQCKEKELQIKTLNQVASLQVDSDADGLIQKKKKVLDNLDKQNTELLFYFILIPHIQ